MRTVSSQSFAQAVEARKRSLGVTDEVIARARNSGQRRAPEKRALIARTQARAILAGVEPLPANF
jgi:hypothetical protein